MKQVAAQLPRAGPVYCSRELLVKKCFPVLDAGHYDWTNFAFLADHAVYQLTCARFVASSHHLLRHVFNPLKGSGVNWLHLAIQVKPTFLISDIRAL